MNRFALLGLGVITAACAAVPRNAPLTSMRTLSSEASAGITRLREATRPYQSLAAAAAAGYAPKVEACLVHEHHGAMGYHHSNPKYVDKVLDVERPEILLYERMPNGDYRLNGVEFIVPYRAWPRDSVAPELMGQKLRHEDNLKIWYLHAWAWNDNADGMFADFNPTVQCGADRKVFTPFANPPARPAAPSRE